MTKPLNEVWEVADYLIRLSIPHLEKLASPDYIVNKERRPIYKVQLANCRKSLEMLRRVLLERCFEEHGLHIVTMKDGRLFIGPDSGTWGDLEGMLAEPKMARDVGSAFYFLAWELEQRMKEQEGGSND